MSHFPITGRIGIKNGTAGALTVGGTALQAFTWNNDFLAASFFHMASPDTVIKTDATIWCSKFSSILAADGTTQLLTATNGFNSKTKCTWQFKAADNTVGPSFKLNNASSFDWTF